MIPPDPATESQVERHFIELATRPLEDHPAVRDEARGELMERLSRQDPKQREAMAEEALARLAKVEPASWKGKALGFAMAWLVLTGITVWLGFQFHGEVNNTEAEEYFTEQYSTALAFEALGKSAATDLADLEAQVNRPYGLPPDFKAVWRKLDPDNGAWAWREALDRFDIWQGASGPSPGDFDQVWALVEQAANAPRFEYYQPERRAERITQIGNPETCATLALHLNLSHFWGSSGLDNQAAGVFADKIRPLVEAKDAAGLRAVIRVWEKLCLRIATEAYAAQDLDRLNGLATAGDRLLTAARDLGMTAEAERIELQCKVLSQGSLGNRVRGGIRRPEMGALARGIYLYGPAPSSEALTPGRMKEHALAERFCALVGAALLILPLAVLCIEGVRRGRRVNGLATGLSPLFDGSDGLWLLGLGLLAPLVWYWGITRLTPLGHRDVGFMEFQYPPTLFQALATLLLALVLIIQTAQWRIGHRVRVLGLAPGYRWIGWAIVGIAAALVAVAGIGRWLPHSQMMQFLQITAAACGIPLLWVLWRGGVLLFGPNGNALPGVLLSRAATLPLTLWFALLVAANPLLLATEKNWMAQDEVGGWDARRGTTKQEARSVDLVIARCRELFENPKKQ